MTDGLILRRTTWRIRSPQHPSNHQKQISRSASLDLLEQRIIKCRKCPRLVRYLKEIKKSYPACWCQPVPAFGNSTAQIALVGLAPGRLGSNCTGRMFTGDGSGDFLYPVLYELGLASKPAAKTRNDGLKLQNCFISAVARCAPPGNKPTRHEISNCVPYLIEELSLLVRLEVVVALGKIAHDEYIKIRLKEEQGKLADYPFRHGAIYRFQARPKILISSYHPSRQNTNTGKLTKVMFLNIFRRALSELKKA
jgi:uracil-DNA glycosylase family 4